MGKSRAKKPTRDQKKIISGAGLIARNWLVIRDNEEGLELVNKLSGRSRKVKK